MGIFSRFKTPAKQPEDLFDAVRSQSPSPALFGGKFMSADDFQHLTEKVADLDPRIRFSTILGGSASGIIFGGALGEALVRLRPLESKKNEGLVLSTTLAPLSPGDSVNVITDMIGKMRNIMFIPTGSTVAVENGKVHFATMMLKGPSGFTDSKLRALVNMNVVLGDEVMKALVTVHQRQASPYEAMNEFSSAFTRFMNSLSSELKAAYTWSTNARRA